MTSPGQSVREEAPPLRLPLLNLRAAMLLIVTSLLLLAGWSTAVPLAGPPYTAWRIETFGDDHNVAAMGTATGGLAIDEHGRPHIAWSIRGADDVTFGHYMVRDLGGIWHDEIITPPDHDVGGLALDSQGNPHTVAEKFADTKLFYLTRTSTGWEMEATGHQGLKPSLFLDETERPHIIARQPGALLIHLVREDDGTWTRTVVESNTGGPQPKATMDADGQFHVVYTLHGSKLRYAHQQADGSWNIEPVDNFCGHTNVGLDLDSQGNPHISCNKDPGVYYFQRLQDGTWVGEHAYAGHLAGWGNDLRIGPDDRVHIAFASATNPWNRDLQPQHLMLGVRDPTGWTFETVDAMGNWNGYVPTLAFDNQGHPKIAYVRVAVGYGLPAINTLFDLRFAEPIINLPHDIMGPALGKL